MLTYIIIGFIVGSLLFYLIMNGKIQKLIMENSNKVSKDDLALRFVSRDLYDSVTSTLEYSKENLDTEKKSNEANLAAVIRLTEESGNKISKAEVERNFVAREGFEFVKSKLTNAESEILTRDQTILRLSNELMEFQQKEQHLNQMLTTFKDELQALHLRSQVEFKNLANEVLDEKKKNFVDENKKELNTILSPFKSDLNTFKEKVEATRKEDIADLTSLKDEIKSLQQLNYQLSDDAKNLASALKSEVKMQGNWGEDRLNMIFEVEGLQKYIDYTREEIYRDDEQERNRKPDFILKLPNGKHIIIDSKVSLTAYVNYFNAPTADEKFEHLKQHLKSITEHVNSLADKNYQSLTGLSTPDYVFMFMPVESALTLALNQNPEIFNNALKRKIILITPTTLVVSWPPKWLD
jgi:DNA recombination protein RmuC